MADEPRDDPDPRDTPPTDPQAAIAAVEASRLGPAQKRALRLVADGMSYRAAAREAGLRSTADLKRHAKRFGLVEAHNAARATLVSRERQWRTAELIEGMRRVAGAATHELLRRLHGDPDAIALRDLTVAAGVALDKIAKWKRWGTATTRTAEPRWRSLRCRCGDRGRSHSACTRARRSIRSAA